MDINKQVSKRLFRAYENSGLSYLQIEQITGISRATIHRIINCSTQKIDIDSVQLISKALGVSPAYVMGWTDDPDYDVGRSKKEIPIIGRIACGSPILAEENFDGFVNLPVTVKADFALTCKGDSMITARIFDGDIVFIRQQPDVDDGDIAAVLIGDETTLKKVKHYPNRLVLSPCNPMYNDIIFRDEELNDVRILGKAVWFLSEVRK